MRRDRSPSGGLRRGLILVAFTLSGSFATHAVGQQRKLVDASGAPLISRSLRLERVDGPPLSIKTDALGRVPDSAVLGLTQAELQIAVADERLVDPSGLLSSSEYSSFFGALENANLREFERSFESDGALLPERAIHREDLAEKLRSLTDPVEEFRNGLPDAPGDVQPLELLELMQGARLLVAKSVGEMEALDVQLETEAHTEGLSREEKRAIERIRRRLTDPDGALGRVLSDVDGFARATVPMFVSLEVGEATIDGWGLDQTTVTARLLGARVSDDGSIVDDIVCAAPPGGLKVSFVPEACRVEPEFETLGEGDSLLSVEVYSDDFASAGSVTAEAVDFRRSDPVAIEFRSPPWGPLALCALGLACGVFLKRKLAAPAVESSVLVDVVAALFVFVVYVAGVDGALGALLPTLQLRQGWAVKVVAGVVCGVVGARYVTVLAGRLTKRAGRGRSRDAVGP